MKEYRSAIRSRDMIKSAFIKLMAENDLSKITVVDIVNTANISRNTFYAHYVDVYAVLEEIENTFIDKLNVFLDKAIENREFNNPLPLLQRIQHFIENDIQNNKMLIVNKNSYAFCDRLKNIFIERILANLDSTGIKNPNGFLIFLECLASGFIDMYQKSLIGASDISLSEVTKEIGNIFIAGIANYN